MLDFLTSSVDPDQTAVFEWPLKTGFTVGKHCISLKQNHNLKDRSMTWNRTEIDYDLDIRKIVYALGAQ